MLSKESLEKFKSSIDEEKIIGELLKGQVSKYLIEPVLDVGSGTGEITIKTFPEKEIIHLDRNNYEKLPTPRRHSRVTGDFFDYIPDKQIGSLLMSHVFMYIDDDIDKLNSKILKLSPKYLVTVTNTNTGFVSDSIAWFKKNVTLSNEEKELEGFPFGYKKIQTIPFHATFETDDFENLAKWTSEVIFDVILDREQLENFVEYMKDRLKTAKYIIEQEIRVYKRIS